MSAEQCDGSIPSCPANGEREAMVGTDRRTEGRRRRRTIFRQTEEGKNRETREKGTEVRVR